MSDSTELLTRGLTEGFAGKTNIENTTRGGFTLKRSHYENGDDRYHDEWLSARTGGGQEFASTNGEMSTRLYAGGVISTAELSKLGLTQKDVLKYLVSKVKSLGHNTRLFSNCIPDPDDDWQYRYQITDTLISVGLTRSLETIEYKGNLVFAHGFEICQVED